LSSTFVSLIGVWQLDHELQSFDVEEHQINPLGEYILIFWYCAFAGQATQHLCAEFALPFCVQSVASIALVLNSIRPATVSQSFQAYRGYILCSAN
jgi:hypothetical protein